uniref:Uncharacterized protein n=1 Tax=Aegilops tauschii subsp. strangulata TaxID=200361 RepID=A0A453BG58_AEGTS
MLCLFDPHKLMPRLSGCVSTYTGGVFADDQNVLIVASAWMLYGLIHARYILTTKGLSQICRSCRHCCCCRWNRKKPSWLLHI